jgi:hypothetical protein
MHELFLSVMGDLMNRWPDVGGLAVVVDVLLLSVRGKLRNSLPDYGFHYSLDSCAELLLFVTDKLKTDYLTMKSCTVLTAVAICKQLLSVRGQFRSSLPEVGVLYSLDSCGCW